MKEKSEHIAFLEKQYNYYYDALRGSSSRLYEVNYGIIDYVRGDEDEFAEYWSTIYLRRMYNILCTYFETLGLPTYLSDFKNKFEKIVNDDNEVISFSSVILTYGDQDVDLKLLIEWKDYLAPFDFFWIKDEKENSKVAAFLRCTNQILKQTKTVVSIEEDINKVIRNVANWYFSGVIAYSRGYFVHEFTHYKPDVIIKEFGTSIEYKLIRNNNEIGRKLDELNVDMLRYTGNSENKNCIAVFCLSTLVTETEKQILEAWDNMKPPSNWQLIVIPDVLVNTAE